MQVQAGLELAECGFSWGSLLLVFPGKEGRKLHQAWDIRDPDVGISRTKALCKWPFSVVFGKGVAGMSRDLGRDVLDLEKLYARKLWADVLFPRKEGPKLRQESPSTIRLEIGLQKFPSDFYRSLLLSIWWGHP